MKAFQLLVWSLVVAASGLQIVHVNDVYKLSNLPRLRTLIDRVKAERPSEATITTLGGDFLSPSLLSSLDQGRSMVETLGALPVDFACLGNHDGDHGVDALWRAAEDVLLVNSNVPVAAASRKRRRRMPRAVIIEEGSTRVGIAGLCSTDRRLYVRNAFGDGAVERAEDVATCAREMLSYFGRHGVDVALLLTHQDAKDDVALVDSLCSAEGTAWGNEKQLVVLGGHDHEPFEYATPGHRCVVCKAGSDATAAYVVRVNTVNTTVNTGETETANGNGNDDGDGGATEKKKKKALKKKIETKLVACETEAPHPEVQAIVDRHLRRVERLGRTVLREIDHSHRVGKVLSSRNVRTEQTTVGSLCCTAIRKALSADVALLNAGCVRGDADYEAQFFTFADLATELPFETEIATVDVPGFVLKAAFHYSRSTQRGSGGFFQHDNAVETTTADGFLRQVAGEPFDAGQVYSVALPWHALAGMDHNVPLLDWVAKNDGALPPLEAAIPAKHLCLRVYYREIWLALGDTFADIDLNNSGCVDFYELKDAIARRFNIQPTDDLVKDCLLAFDLEDDDDDDDDANVGGTTSTKQQQRRTKGRKKKRGSVIEEEYDACVAALEEFGSYSSDTARRILDLRRKEASSSQGQEECGLS